MKKIIGIFLFVFVNITMILAGAFSASQYREALWMTTRFYGAQRCGYGPNWMIMDHREGNCHIYDSYNGYDVTGGWHDCGDHIKFMHTMGYAAYSLLRAYDAFPEAFEDRYSFDYSGYEEKQSFGYDDGKPNGIPDVLDEAKYAIMFFIKLANIINETGYFVYQVGDGNDHNQWVTSVYQTYNLTTGDGGEKGGVSRPVFATNSSGQALSAMAAGACALFYRVYKKFDPAFAQEALDAAIVLYNYAKTHSGTVSANGNFYPANSTPDDDMIIAASELYMATGDNSYLADAGKTIGDHYWVLCYNNANDYALYAQTVAGAAQGYYTLKSIADRYLDKTDGTGLFTGGDGTWGPLRYNAGAAFSVALLLKLADIIGESLDKTKYENFIYRQVDYILGDNSANLSFVVGFGDNYVQHPHHRNIYLDDHNVADKNALRIPDRNKYAGLMIGGSRNASSYNDNVDTYTGSEGGIDYNAGLVGALAYICAKEAPIDTSSDLFYGVKEIEIPKTFSLNAYPNPFNPVLNISIQIPSDVKIKSISIYDINGKLVETIAKDLKVGTYSFTWNASRYSSGIYFVRVVGNNSFVYSKKVILMK